MKSPLADAERDRLIAAMLPDVPFDGWSQHALRVAAERIGVPVAEARALFPRGAPDMVAAFSRWADRQMLDRLETTPIERSACHGASPSPCDCVSNCCCRGARRCGAAWRCWHCRRTPRSDCACSTKPSTAPGTRSAI